jgi:L-amino acid N-acyltransferase YncA
MKSERENIKIRLATENDFEAIFSIWLDGVNNSFEYKETDKDRVKEKFTSNFKQRNGIFNFWVAVDTHNKIWGWQSLIKTSNNPFRENSFAESSTYIAKDNRLKGIGKQLLEYVMNEAEASQLEYVIGFVALGNEAAKKITKQTGWIEIGQLPSSKKRNSEIKKSFLVRPV